MLLQTNSYIVPKEKRAEHARLMARFRQCFRRLGSPFEVYEQTGPGFTGDGGGRFVQMMRFRDRRHQQEIHTLEKQDKAAQQLIAEFCRLVNLPYQQQQGLFAAGYYASVLQDRPEQTAAPVAPGQPLSPPPAANEPPIEAEADLSDDVRTDVVADEDPFSEDAPEPLEGVLEEEEDAGFEPRADSPSSSR